MRRGVAAVALVLVVALAGCSSGAGGQGPVWIEINEDYAVADPGVRLLAGCEYEDHRVARFSNEGEDWTAWDEFVPERSWQLSDGDGEKRVHLECRAGNTTGNDFDSIILDTTPPTIDLQRPAQGAIYVDDRHVADDPLDETRVLGNLTVVVDVTDGVEGVDAVSGLDVVEIWLDDRRQLRETFSRDTDGDIEVIEWTWGAESQLTEFGPGSHELRIVTTDHVGNEATQSRTIVVAADVTDLPVDEEDLPTDVGEDVDGNESVDVGADGNESADVGVDDNESTV